jgi:putative hydrolase of the HAD superfamily
VRQTPRVTPRALLFDLDNTLLFEDQVTLGAVRAACERARGRADVDALAAAAVRIADERWRAAPTFPYADAMGMWWGEGLWGDFRGDGDDLRAVREFATRFRREVWRDALAAGGGASDDALAAELSDAYRSARRAGELVDPQATTVLEDLSRDHRCGLVTNGAPDVQREKIGRTTLARYFTAIIISAEVGVGKPDPRIFEVALDAIGAAAHATVVIGDSVARDVAGARNAGMRSIWIDRGQTWSRADEPIPDARILALSEIRATLAAMGPAAASPPGSP